ncbi:unnamed protein product [Didymodactylos carnosus]|uniref:Uncharacterized protein n=1 Tax=Didymodactylos carnosus TaxID=1234261 RepID=A0A8S2HAT7_9BILA|nr:unnamed protein product [Didymodactylos carnosus]CAF3599201.1 unnamed protein product [Didymodactylos carnosus]
MSRWCDPIRSKSNQKTIFGISVAKYIEWYVIIDKFGIKRLHKIKSSVVYMSLQVEDIDTNVCFAVRNSSDKERPTIEQPAADNECQTIEQNDGAPSIKLPLNCTVCSHKTCCICRAHIDGSSKTVAVEDRNMIFLTKNVMIREGSRCCREHLEDGRLIFDAINIVKPHKIESTLFKAGDVQLLMLQGMCTFPGESIHSLTFAGNVYIP